MSGDLQMSLFSDASHGDIGETQHAQVIQKSERQQANVVELSSFLRKAPEPKQLATRAELLQRVLDRAKNF